MQILESEGNVALFCKSGRSRSPVYFAAYLVMCHDFAVYEAVKCVESLLLEQRNQIMDRYQCFVPVLAKLN